MTNHQLKELETKLWDSANSFRAYGGLKASEYAFPVLGLIFLRFADNKYSHFEQEILAEYDQHKDTRMERTIPEIALATCGFYLPKDARYDYLLNLSSDKSMAKALRKAMEGIEKYQDVKFQGVLPTETYFKIEKKKKDILPQLLKTFSDIPKDATGDVFGKIYEYFLGKFALSEGQKGGEFFTPTSVVRFIVEVIEPYSGKIYDPACGSGGMFVQSADFIKNANHDLSDIYVYGQEKQGETVRLAKMNLLVNNLRGEIMEVNSYDDDPYNSYGKFDFVMANPPFNVKSVKVSTVKDDQRFYEYGLPKTKGKEDIISNANYLWISLFANSLNKNGRAGFVMANSASDARNTEKDIRQKIVDSGIVDCMVSMPSNMFFTVTLPATLWFFDKQKVRTDRKDKILFIDARNVFRQIDRAHREWTPEQQQNLATIVRLYRGETHRFLERVQHYIQRTNKALVAIEPLELALAQAIQSTASQLAAYAKKTQNEKRSPAKTKALKEANFFTEIVSFTQVEPQINTNKLTKLQAPFGKTPLDNKAQRNAALHLAHTIKQHQYNAEALKKDVNSLTTLWKLADTKAKLSKDKIWAALNLAKADKILQTTLESYLKAIEKARYWQENIDWLQKRFPKANYQDVIGLCKVADRSEYVDEQDYSLNAGRYVGVVIEDDNISVEEFQTLLTKKSEQFFQLTRQSNRLESIILSNIKKLGNV